MEYHIIQEYRLKCSDCDCSVYSRYEFDECKCGGVLDHIALADTIYAE